MEHITSILLSTGLPRLALITGVFVLAGMIKGVIGLGLPTVAVGLLGIVMTPMEAAAMLVVPSMVTNVWQLAAGPAIKLMLRRLWAMLLGVCIGTLAGGAMLPANGSAYASAWLGVALVLYALIGIAAVPLHVPEHAERWLGPLAGLLTGSITAATGVFVIPAVPYLQGLRLDKETMIQALGLAFTTSTVALAASLSLNGDFKLAAAGLSLYALLPALGGMFVGQWIRTRIRPEVFRKCFFIGLLGLGLHLAWQSLTR